MGVPNGTVTLAWGDGEYVFNVAKIGQALELEETCNATTGKIFARLLSAEETRFADWSVRDVREIIRLGLIGGGLEPIKALALVKRYVDERPWYESVLVAKAVLMVAIFGVPGDEVGKKESAEPTKTEAQTNASSAPQSTVLEQPSGSPQDKPTKSRFGNLPPASKASTGPTTQTRGPSPQAQPSSTR